MMDGEFSAYDHGARRGMFDKCNGRPRNNFVAIEANAYNVIYMDGYNDAYNSNTNKFEEATDEQG